jgi:hypothetical protein
LAKSELAGIALPFTKGLPVARLNAISWDGTGPCLFANSVEKGRSASRSVLKISH